VLDEGTALRAHAAEFLRRVDEQVETRPDFVDALEVSVAFQERALGVGHDHQVEVALLVGFTTSH
jgi:hypothetical protein